MKSGDFMKTVFKLLASIVAVTLVLTMAACKGDNDSTTTDEAQTEQTTTSSVAADATTQTEASTADNTDSTGGEPTTEGTTEMKLETKADVLNYFNTCIN